MRQLTLFSSLAAGALALASAIASSAEHPAPLAIGAPAPDFSLPGVDGRTYTDLGDSLEDMKLRAAHRALAFPFLYDGETQEATARYGPTLLASFPDDDYTGRTRTGTASRRGATA